MMSDLSSKNDNIILVSIYDKVSGLFTPPYAFSNKKVCFRAYINLLKPISDKQQYSLYLIGEFDNTLGCINSIEPIKVADGDTCLIDEFNFLF